MIFIIICIYYSIDILQKIQKIEFAFELYSALKYALLLLGFFKNTY